ncbi:leucine-rich melanocyte differentiation-associated protein-like isoform X2 [Chrysoperla carnea]|nr:leucine-rich melanocyte differentiation-associated protein-like isoform X2 [Chrysoperla carnea]XP_044742401.1 leucine-rich melanocyte differentiation-associated protein-like isoform X2 [Chrysoperla carnea]
MTSLGTLVFLEQRSYKHGSTDNNEVYMYSSDEDKRLTLAYEKLKTIPQPLIDRFALAVHSLDISHNEISNVDFLCEFKYLSSLVADHNEITSETVFPHMPQLELLWLNHCKIQQLYPWARKLQLSCPNLKHLSLMGNPAAPSYLNGGSFYDYLQYRLFIISLFPKLIHLDDRPITTDQRNEAERIYKHGTIRKKIETRALSALPTMLREHASILLQSYKPIYERNIRNSII